MRVEFALGLPEDFLLGIIAYQGEDEFGKFQLIGIGIGLFSIEFYMY